MHYLSSVSIVIQPLRASGISVAHHQEVYCIYIYIYIYIHTHTQQSVCDVLFSLLLAGQQIVN